MLVPLTRAKFEQLIPVIATGPQYRWAWGRPRDWLQKLLISVVGLVLLLLLSLAFEGFAQGLDLFFSIVVGLYWLWGPVYWASVKNARYRRYKYGGFWRGRILDIFISDDLIEEIESFNQRGELTIVENRERRINLEIGDETGFRAVVQAPLQRVHKLLASGQGVEGVVFSNQPDLSRIERFSDLYIPSQDLWVGEYPILQRDVLREVSANLRPRRAQPSVRRRSRRSP